MVSNNQQAKNSKNQSKNERIEDFSVLQNKYNSIKNLLLLSNKTIWETDSDFKFVFTSENKTSLPGYNSEELNGKSIFDFILHENKNQLKKELQNKIERDNSFSNFEISILSKDDKVNYMLISGITLFEDDGKIKNYFGVLENNTKEKKEHLKLQSQKQKAEKDSKSKSLFLAKMSHEIRNPMNGIIGTVNLLKDTKLSINQRDFLDIIKVSGNSLMSIINDILDISKIEAGKIELENEDFNVNILINDIMKMLGYKAAEKRLIFRKEINENVPEIVKGDIFRLKQVIINLTNNAIKFTKQGYVTIEVEKLQQNNNQVKLKFKVVDTGIGISKEGKRKLFQEFSQTDASISRKYGGSGLGLIISKKFIELMGGEIFVESKEGEGSTFWFVLEMEIGTKIISEQSNLKKVPTEIMKKKLSILMVEDNIINQKVTMANLFQFGHDVEIAENGKKAVEMFISGEYDIILMDIQMPVMDGYEATKEIRKYEEKNNISDKIKIVAITANAMKEDRSKCLKAGMNEYITKPIKQAELKRVLKI